MGVEEKVQEVVHNAAFNAFYEEQSQASQEKLRKKKIRSKVERSEDGAVKSTIESLVSDFKPKRYKQSPKNKYALTTPLVALISPFLYSYFRHWERVSAHFFYKNFLLRRD